MSATIDPPRGRPPSPTASTAVVVLAFTALVPAWLARQQAVLIPSAAQAEQNSVALRTRLNPNTADAAELMTLRGIGETLARRIVEFRNQHAASHGGPVFTVPSDLERVRGIGPKKVHQFQEGLTFGPDPASP